MPSAVIRAFEYDAPGRRLAITFQSGRRYVYVDVPPEVHEGMKMAFSKGDYFNAHIRERYAFERATAADD